MADIEIISRPKPAAAPENKGGIEIISRPSQTPQAPAAAPAPAAPLSPPQRPPSSFLDRLMANYRDEVGAGAAQFKEGSQAGADAMKQGGVNPLFTPGGGRMLAGAARYMASPVEAVGKTVLGDPVRNVAGAAGAPAWLAEALGTTANMGGQMFGAGPAVRAVENAPSMAREALSLVTKAGEKAAPLARSAVNTVDDVVKNQLEQATRRQMEKEAGAAPTRADLKTQSDAAYKAAAEAGANVKPEAFGTFADNIPEVLKAEKVTSGSIPISDKIYKETKDLKDRLEDYRGHELTLENLQTLQQEANGFVKKALIAAEGDRGAQDVRGAQIISKQIKDFVQNLTPEQVASGNPEQAVAALNKAKELWRRNAKMDTIENIVDVATKLKDPNYLQSQFRGLVKDNIEMSQFSPAERKLIEDIAANSRLEQIGEAVTPNKIQKGVQIVRGVNNGRMAKAKELMDMIARGEAAQAAPEGPSIGQRISDMLRPEPPNSRSRNP